MAVVTIEVPLSSVLQFYPEPFGHQNRQRFDPVGRSVQDSLAKGFAERQRLPQRIGFTTETAPTGWKPLGSPRIAGK